MTRPSRPRSRRGAPVRAALTLALVAGSLGCATKVSTRAFEVVAAPNANRNSPVPVDVVLVRAEPLVAAVSVLSADEWFQGREQLLKDHPADLEVRSWELVPGQILEIDRFPFPSRKGFALVVFADYLSDGVHRLRVDPLREFRLILNVDGFEAQETR